ncbi:MAG: FlgD immunoglobulin-like domain containing protein, partial [Bacteroidota bacterium]
QVFGFGPYSVAASGTKRVGFALVGGTSFANCVAAGRVAQRAWVQRLGNTINVVLVSVPDPTAGIPETFELAQNYPNPFNPSTTIRYALPEAARVNLSIYNVLGQRVAELTNEVQSAGFYNAVWNGHNQAGSQVATGVYFYRIEATPVGGDAPFISFKKMLLVK